MFCLSIAPSLLWTLGNHWSFRCLYSFTFSRMLYSWNHTVCSIFRLVSFTKQYVLRFLHVLFLGFVFSTWMCSFWKYVDLHTCNSYTFHTYAVLQYLFTLKCSMKLIPFEICGSCRRQWKSNKNPRTSDLTCYWIVQYFSVWRKSIAV